MTRVWAHRGANRVAPQNTPAAFAAAAAMGAHGVELDVWLVDGRLLVVHDRPPADPSGLPTLAAALAACAGMTVNVEIKEPIEAVGPVLDAVDGLDVVVSSFDPAVIDRVRALAPDVRTGYLLFGGDVGRAVAHCREAGHGAIHPFHTLVDEAFMAAADGLAVHAWTANETGRIRELAALGVDAVITDVPDVALAALGDQ